VNIAEMMAKGIPESEILAEWLDRLCLSDYLALFVSQGYDLMSIARITPEDLNSLGITRPEDRKRLCQDIQHWHLVDDCWPTFVSPESGVREWLTAIGLKQYVELFEREGFVTMRELEKITWEDLEDIGVKKLGHMKRICLALKKLKQNRSALIHGDRLNAKPSTSSYQTHNSRIANHPPSLSARGPSHGNPAYHNTVSGRLSVVGNDYVRQRPVVQVPPNSRQTISQEFTDDCATFKNNAYGMDTLEKRPSKLTLVSTQQILSELSEMPRCLNGKPLIDPSQPDPIFSAACPPPPGMQKKTRILSAVFQRRYPQWDH
jgi:hypothetical protein